MEKIPLSLLSSYEYIAYIGKHPKLHTMKGGSSIA